MKSRACWLAIVALAAAVQVSPLLEVVSAQSGASIVISEFRFRGALGVNDEFIELFNGGPAPVNVGGWLIRSSNNVQPPGVFTRATIPAGTVINPGCYYLIANNGAGGYVNPAVPPNLTYATGFADDGGVALTLPDLTRVDQVGIGANAAFGEGTRLPALTTNENRSYERLPGGTAGHADTNNNAADFRLLTPSHPQNASSSCVTMVKQPHEVQGTADSSPLVSNVVTVQGVVTARTSDGFFIQTEPAHEDADPQSSEGLFVSTPGGAPAAAQSGRLVDVRGTVTEYVPPANPSSASMTMVTAVTGVTDVGAASLPAPFMLTASELSGTGSPGQLERFEGMRVAVASLTTVTGTDADGAFHAVLTGQARPFRELGVAPGSPVLACASAPCAVPLFDGNPERFRIDSDGIEGTARVDVSSGASAADVVGPLAFVSGSYTLLPETSLVMSGGVSPVASPPAAAGQFTVAALNVDGSNNTAKASLAIIQAMNLPDIVGVHGAPDAAFLSALAARIDNDRVAGGGAPVGYVTFGAGLLVNPARVPTASSEEVGSGATFLDPSDGTFDPLFDRAPLVLNATVQAPPGRLPQSLSVVDAELDSTTSVNDAGPVGARARARRQAQAEYLANYVQNAQLNDPSAAVVVLGNLNAFRSHDGYVDVTGTVLGTPASADQVANASADLVSPDLVDLAASLPAAMRYSRVTGGDAHSLDHVMTTASLLPQYAGFAYARVNADFADVWQGDSNTPLRFSDRDPSVAYFTFAPDQTAPVLDTPSNVTAEATGPGGAAVAFALPAASDNLDTAVVVTCAPVSGSVFPLGATPVNCQATDAAGNTGHTSFTVTVADTTPPQLSLPSNVMVQADSAAGRTVQFTASASDAVTPSPVVTCVPQSGSVFAPGTTTVQCTSVDGAGNPATGSFTITVNAAESPLPTTGSMEGHGHVKSAAGMVQFNFLVKQSGDRLRGGVVVTVHTPRHGVTVGLASLEHAAFTGNGVSFTAEGSWNGRRGFTFDVMAVDGGRGFKNDTFTLVVRSAAGAIVASASGRLHDGNIQLSSPAPAAALKKPLSKYR